MQALQEEHTERWKPLVAVGEAILLAVESGKIGRGRSEKWEPHASDQYVVGAFISRLSELGYAILPTTPPPGSDLDPRAYEQFLWRCRL